MSMIHFLTIGFFDPAAVSRRELCARGVLNEEVLALVRSFADVDNEGTLGGHPLEVTGSAIRCVWYAPAYNRRAAELAIAATKCGCVVADVEHGRIVEVAELERPLR